MCSSKSSPRDLQHRVKEISFPLVSLLLFSISLMDFHTGEKVKEEFVTFRIMHALCFRYVAEQTRSHPCSTTGGAVAVGGGGGGSFLGLFVIEREIDALAEG